MEDDREHTAPRTMSGSTPMSTSASDEPTGCIDPEVSKIDGGFKAWGVVVAAFCMQMVVFGVINSCAIFEDYFQDHQLRDRSPFEISWIFSLYLFLLYFLGLFVGPAFDRYGHRGLSLAGSATFVASLMLLSICTEYYQMVLTFSALGGLGGALLNTTSLGAINHFFLRKRGLATGIATSAGGLGGVIFPFVLRATLPRLGFAWSMRILGFTLLALGVVSNALLRTRPRKGSERGILPNFTALRDRSFQLCCVGILLMEYGVLTPLTFIVSYASSQGQPSSQSYLLPALLNAGSVLGRLIPGFLSDKIGRFNMLILTILGCAVSVFAVWLPSGSSSAAIIAFALLLGYASGGNVSLVPVCIGQICDTAHFGRTLTTAMLAASIGTLTGIPLGGAILGPGPSPRYTMLILFSGLSYTVALVCFIMARVAAVGWRIRVIF